MPQWGANTSNSARPSWSYLTGQNGQIGNLANVFATTGGWAHRWPWGDELLVALDSLNPGPTAQQVLAGTAPRPGTAQTVQITVQFNEAVAVAGTPTIVAIGTGGAANVTLSYASASSNVVNGTLVFNNTNVDLTGDNSLSLVINTSSVLGSWTGITGAINANATTNTLAVGNTITIAAS